MDDLSVNESDEKVMVRIANSSGKELDSFLVSRGSHLWTFLRKREIFRSAGCSGVGGCGRCAVRLAPADVFPVGPAESQALQRLTLPEGIRLSCHLFVSASCTVVLPEEVS